MFSELVTLLGAESESIDEYGDIVRKREEKKVFVRLDRIFFSEALQAMSQGFTRQVRFRLSDYYDYNGEEALLYEGKLWKIVNTQRIGKEIEINCIGGVEHGRA